MIPKMIVISKTPLQSALATILLYSLIAFTNAASAEESIAISPSKNIAGVAGIRTGGVRGIRTGGVRGIRTGGVRGIRTGGVRTYEGSGISDDLQLAAIGPASVKDSGLSILGQNIVLDDITEVISIPTGEQAVGVDAASLISSGDNISVAGEVMDPGQILATVIVITKNDYVHGADSAYLKARVSSVNPITAIATSVGSTIDYAASLYNGSTNSFAVGDVIEASGFTSPDSNTIYASAAQKL